MINKHVMIIENSGKGNSLKINESLSKPTKMKLEGKFTEFDIENRNKRMYTSQNFLPYMNLMLEKKKSLGILYGEYDHPDVFDITCKNLSHVIDTCTFNESGNCVDGSITLLNNSWGKEAQSIIGDGYPLFVSSRAAGVTDSNGVVQLKELFTYDIVADPGFSSARVTPINESLGFKSNDDVPYRIYEITNESQINALFNDNKNDKKTAMDLTQMELFLRNELQKFENKLNESIKDTKNFAPEDTLTLLEQVDFIKKELSDVNSVLESFKSNMSILVKENESLKEENIKLATEISETIMHSNHLTSNFKKLTKYATQIDERLNLSEGLLEHTAKNVKANIYFSKDISENLKAIKESVLTSTEALEYLVNDNASIETKIADLTGYTEEMASEVNDITGYTEHLALESKKDNVWLNYIHEKVDGVIQYTNKVVETLKTDNVKLNESNSTTTEIAQMEDIESYLGLDQEHDALNDIEAQADINTTQVEEEPETEEVIDVDGVEEIPTSEITEEPNEVEEIPTEVEETEVDMVDPIETIEASLLNQLVKVLSTDETGIVIEITPDNKIIIQKSGSEETEIHDIDNVEAMEYTTDNVVETVTSVLAEIKKQKNLEVNPHFFEFLTAGQIAEFKSLDKDTQSTIISEIATKEYFSADDVLGFIADHLSSKAMPREEKLVTLIPQDIKESWDNLADTTKKVILAESKYFPLTSEMDMINFWNSRSFAKELKSPENKMIKESLNHLNSIDGDTNYEEAFFKSFNNLK